MAAWEAAADKQGRCLLGGGDRGSHRSYGLHVGAVFQRTGGTGW